MDKEILTALRAIAFASQCRRDCEGILNFDKADEWTNRIDEELDKYNNLISIKLGGK